MGWRPRGPSSHFLPRSGHCLCTTVHPHKALSPVGILEHVADIRGKARVVGGYMLKKLRIVLGLIQREILRGNIRSIVY